jgi:hypothetical protein
MPGRMFYRSLTGFADLWAMRSWLASYLRFAGFSVVALAIAACAKLAPAEAGTRPEPLFGDPPEAGQMAADPATTISEAERIAALEAQVEKLGDEIAHLRKALDVLGPLPDQEGMFIPVAKSEITGEIADAETEANIRLANLYSPAPTMPRASSLFYEAELGSFATKLAAEARWKQLRASNRLAGLEPHYDAFGSEIRLGAGPLMSENAVAALCVELSSLAGQCRVAAPIRTY